MAEIKILLEDNEELQDVKDSLVKAFQIKPELEEGRYDDPLMNTLLDHMDDEYKSMYLGLVSDILETLKEPI